jgi:hypothetical protein
MFERGKEKPRFVHSELARKIFLEFEARSDDPGEFLSGEEKDKLQKETLTNPEALMKWEKNRNSKYRINSLHAPIAASEIFLKSKEADSVPNDVKEELISRINSAYEDLKKSKGKRIEKKLVDEVKEIVNEVSKYLK